MAIEKNNSDLKRQKKGKTKEERGKKTRIVYI